MQIYDFTICIYCVVHQGFIKAVLTEATNTDNVGICPTQAVMYSLVECSKCYFTIVFN